MVKVPFTYVKTIEIHSLYKDKYIYIIKCQSQY